MKENIVRWYRQGLWSAKMVHDAVDKKIITEADYQEILAAKSEVYQVKYAVEEVDANGH